MAKNCPFLMEYGAAEGHNTIECHFGREHAGPCQNILDFDGEPINRVTWTKDGVIEATGMYAAYAHDCDIVVPEATPSELRQLLADLE